MRQLLYVSSSAPDVTEDEIAKILASAHRNNPRAGVTGMLLFVDGNFLQLIEGEDEAVERTFRRIKRDRRHSDVEVLLNERVTHRAFAEWSMGFENLEKTADPDTEAAFEISRMAIERRIAPGSFWVVRRMMETFYEINTRKHLDLTALPMHREPMLARAAG